MAGDNESYTENKYNAGCLMSTQVFHVFFFFQYFYHFFLSSILSSLSSSSSSDDSTDSSSIFDSDEFSFSEVVSNLFLLGFLQILFFDVLDSTSLIWSCSGNSFCETSLEQQSNLHRLTSPLFLPRGPLTLSRTASSELFIQGF